MSITGLITNFAEGQIGAGVDPVEGGNTLVTDITAILNGIIAVLGLACVVVIIYGGVQYMTSTGDTTKVKNAKNTILYGIVGLVVCVLAFAIVNFIIKDILDQ